MKKIQMRQTMKLAQNTARQAMSKLQWVCDVDVEPTCLDIEEKELVKAFLGAGCGCQLWEQRCCSLQFSVKHVEEVRSQCASLSRNELDMVLLGQIMAASNTSNIVVATSGHQMTNRIKAYTRYSHQGLNVCAVMFRFLHGVGTTRIKNLAKGFRMDGLTPRIHGNTKRSPKWTLSLQSENLW